MSQVASLTKRSYKLFVVNQFKSHPIVDIEEIKKFRRELHQHPEISGKEQETAKRIAARLSTLNPAVLQTGIGGHGDRKSTRLNSSHVAISYAVFCLKKTRNI